MTAREALIERYGKSFMCIALVKPSSAIDREWNLAKPGYAIFEFDIAWGGAELRWGDGSWQTLQRAEQLDDLIILHDCGQALVDELFD